MKSTKKLPTKSEILRKIREEDTWSHEDSFWDYLEEKSKGAENQPI
jgi:hypothetical protein